VAHRVRRGRWKNSRGAEYSPSSPICDRARGWRAGPNLAARAGTTLAALAAMKVFDDECMCLLDVAPVEARAGAGSRSHIYWHRELPPLHATAIGEFVVEATSSRVPGTLAHRDELWERCYRELMDQAATRMEQEIVRLRGRYAHVLQESIDSRHADATGESWLHGTFRFVLLV
jgi:hypothetical protein